MKLQAFKVQYETLAKQPGKDHGYMQVQSFDAYSEQHLQTVMKEQLGYNPPIYYIIEPQIAQTSEKERLLTYLEKEFSEGKTEFRIATQDSDGSHWYVHPIGKGGETLDIYTDLHKKMCNHPSYYVQNGGRYCEECNKYLASDLVVPKV